uniref:Putative ovule protein n=1 Tax=Solanum chacoense TaxID=4108 RepID=A0A0V0GQ28_SOLCH
MFIAAKVERFINLHRNRESSMEPRLTDKNIPYADALRSSKWSNRGESSFNAEVTLKGGSSLH